MSKWEKRIFKTAAVGFLLVLSVLMFSCPLIGDTEEDETSSGEDEKTGGTGTGTGTDTSYTKHYSYTYKTGNVIWTLKDNRYDGKASAYLYEAARRSDTNAVIYSDKLVDRIDYNHESSFSTTSYGSQAGRARITATVTNALNNEVYLKWAYVFNKTFTEDTKPF
jgi:hypothetical protein